MSKVNLNEERIQKIKELKALGDQLRAYDNANVYIPGVKSKMEDLKRKINVLEKELLDMPALHPPMELRAKVFYETLDGSQMIFKKKLSPNLDISPWAIEFDESGIPLRLVRVIEDPLLAERYVKHIMPIVILSDEEIQAKRELAKSVREKIREQRKIQEAIVKPEWKCPKCGIDNLDEAQRCYKCSTPRPLENLATKLKNDDQQKSRAETLLDRIRGRD